MTSLSGRTIWACMCEKQYCKLYIPPTAFLKILHLPEFQNQVDQDIHLLLAWHKLGMAWAVLVPPSKKEKLLADRIGRHSDIITINNNAHYITWGKQNPSTHSWSLLNCRLQEYSVMCKVKFFIIFIKHLTFSHTGSLVPSYLHQTAALHP